MFRWPPATAPARALWRRRNVKYFLKKTVAWPDRGH
jgi:hypothetical protein